MQSNQQDCAQTRVRSLLNVIKEGRDQETQDAICELTELGHTVLPFLVEAFKDKDEEIYKAASKVLEKLSPPPVAELIALLKEENDEIRRSAAGLLRRIGPLPTWAAAPLCQSL